ncbi:Stk1 family PASTA domain-containing Ser/Thr kinase [Frigoribacterium sp. CG_9.8]|uniref:Stk1 family PASTA domain-containing Ser/Thr kinase n=1 Tax=Frigoribacterium sp. CG_9.8 TaxID=2787733 RepID=UPI0018CB9B5C|nr:serine/threonine-protein kinase [Frigoribacterium sp. CG_9.8]
MTEGNRLLAGRYEVGALIGRGGMSDVHVGTDIRLGRRVAIKLLKPALATDPRFRVLFREEAQKAARMAHPTIVRVFDAGEETVREPNGIESQVPYIVMEFVDGRLLKDIVAEGPLEPKEAVRIVSGILTALEYSHRALLVHRDIKPGNVMVTQNGQVKVMDFGIARAVSDNSATVSDTSAVLGTAQYFSPEQARGETVDARTDLYSTGVVLFELLTGRPPFRGDRAAAVAYQHISEAAVAPSMINPRVSPSIDSVVLRALVKDKFQRFQTAAEFRQDLEDASAGGVPPRKPPAGDFNSTLLGVNPSATAGSEATLRQLSTPADTRSIRTQNRPPVAWIWVGIIALAVMLVAVVIWVANLPPATIGNNLSVNVPSVAGQLYDQGAAKLTGAGLKTTRLEQASSTVENGHIISTEPSGGEKVAQNTTVLVTVSSGKTPTSIPSLSNLTVEAAKTALQSRKLAMGTNTPENSATITAGTVIRSDPAASTAAREGDVVNLFISTGLVAIPSVVGADIGNANTQLGELQLTISPVADSSCAGNKVTSQSITGDQPQRSTITLTYCSG